MQHSGRMHLAGPISEPPGLDKADDELRVQPCGAAAGSCLWPPGDRVRALLPDGLSVARPVLWGDLGDMHAGDLLSLLLQQRRTGLLVVSSEGVERALAFIAGDVVWAVSEVLAEASGPAEVIYGLLGGSAGTFSFLKTDAAALPQGEPLKTQALLLDGIRRLDESRHTGADSEP